MIKTPIPVLRSSFRLFSVAALIVSAVTFCFSWGSIGHRLINLKAVIHLPDSMASLKADSLFYRAHASDADNRKNYNDTSFFSEAERHYIDIDTYPDFHNLPHNLDSVIMLYGRANVRQNGTNPWAAAMVFDSLVAQLSRGNIAKAESTMSDLGHYVADGHQPLHCTANYDGQMTGNNGIHSRYETSMISTYQGQIIIHPDSIHYVASPIDFIFNYIYHSNIYVDSILAADTYAKTASGWSGSGNPPAAYYTYLWQRTGGFTTDLFQRATVALASLWYTAWEKAQTVPVNIRTITAVPVGWGAIYPSGSVLVNDGHDTTFTFTPSTGYHVDSVLVDGIRVDSTARYTFANVTANHSINVYFSVNRYAVSAYSFGSGAVSPSGTCEIQYGGDTTFLFLPQAGYHVDSVVVDGGKVDSARRYTFHNVISPHTLTVWFAVNIYSITADAGPHGSITPTGIISITYGGSRTFTVKADSGYQVDNILVDGGRVDSSLSYTFAEVSGNHTIYASFMEYTASAQIAVADKWNMLSISMKMGDYRKSVLFPHASSPAFSYQGRYVSDDTLKPGAGYWMKFSIAETLTIFGGPRIRDTVNVNTGWNLLGTLSAPLVAANVQALPPASIQGSFFGYNGRYETVDTLYPMRAYWVRISQAGQLVMDNSTLMKGTAPRAAGLKNSLEELNRIIVTDSKGNEQILYFGEMPASIDKENFELPPLPPPGSYDVRYGSQKMAEIIKKDDLVDLPVLISSAHYPITLSWDIRKPVGARLSINSEEALMDVNGSIKLTSPDVSLKLKLSGSALALPKGYFLGQNYPNPFNPGTLIKYQLPVPSRVSLKVYDMLGRFIETLADEVQDAGSKSVQWRAGNKASGVYFYRLEATSVTDPNLNFTQVKNMVLAH